MDFKIFDCITFYDENLITNARFEILKDVVDFFIVCESKYDHNGNKKKINFKLKNDEHSKKIRHIVIEENFPELHSGWAIEEYQREKILPYIEDAKDDDYVMYSDSDEIPNPEILRKFNLKKKYGIFLQRFFNYKFNIFNPYESPWEGTKVCKKKNLKSIDFMREKVRKKNLRYKFYRFDKEKNIQIFENAGWHFNNVMSPEKISKKLKTFAHNEFSSEEFSSVETIRNKINAKVDLFNRNEKYEVVRIDEGFPKYLLNNLLKFKDYIAN
jgi:beta-1,4-mannosyl-glycoprotein beta-1,4-N-acetylglucosaminyltransferase